MAHFTLRGGVITLLAVYLAVFVYSPASVPHLHHAEEASHSDSCRKDPCHVAIYHSGEENSCTHKCHFTKAAEECPHCKLILLPQVVTTPAIFAETATFWFAVTDNYLADILILSGRLASDRGPPHLG